MAMRVCGGKGGWTTVTAALSTLLLVRHTTVSSHHQSVARPFVVPPSASSATGTRTRVARVRAEYPNQLDYSGFDNKLTSITHDQLLRIPSRWSAAGSMHPRLRWSMDQRIRVCGSLGSVALNSDRETPNRAKRLVGAWLAARRSCKQDPGEVIDCQRLSGWFIPHLSGWTQVSLARAAWVQIPQVSLVISQPQGVPMAQVRNGFQDPSLHSKVQSVQKMAKLYLSTRELATSPITPCSEAPSSPLPSFSLSGFLFADHHTGLPP